jgi:hypothetical protein
VTSPPTAPQCQIDAQAAVDVVHLGQQRPLPSRVVPHEPVQDVPVGVRLTGVEQLAVMTGHGEVQA